MQTNFHNNHSSVSPEIAHNTKISSFDYLLLQNTNAKTPMTIVGCMCCEATATIEQVRRTALTLVTVHERLRCRVVGREWIEAEDFNVLEHTQEIWVRPPEALTSVLEEYVASELPEVCITLHRLAKKYMSTLLTSHTNITHKHKHTNTQTHKRTNALCGIFTVHEYPIVDSFVASMSTR